MNLNEVLLYIYPKMTKSNIKLRESDKFYAKENYC